MKATWAIRVAIGLAFVLAVFGLQNPNEIFDGGVVIALAFGIVVWASTPHTDPVNVNIRSEIRGIVEDLQRRDAQRRLPFVAGI